ncbi:MAG: type II toxin-antitoxin system HigB family toxin [Candidatus Zixiibacteriota bacterium]|nr:MAG: type II toxin-antitoxin system HigB family toxin [candidate division Zixibacteria bacterium]
MQIIGEPLICEFQAKHPNLAQPLSAWYHEAKRAKWKTPQDIKDRYATASFVGNHKVWFNIKGNNYRLLAHINYRLELVMVEWIGKHADYDRRNKKSRKGK